MTKAVCLSLLLLAQALALGCRGSTSPGGWDAHALDAPALPDGPKRDGSSWWDGAVDQAASDQDPGGDHAVTIDAPLSDRGLAIDKALPTGCQSNADCDDGNGCNGDERCDKATGKCLAPLPFTCPVAPPECNQSGGSPGPTAKHVTALTNTAGFRLRDEGRWTANYATIAAIEAHASTKKASLDLVLQNLNRTGNQSVTPSLYCLNSFFRWNAGDDAVTYWYPQGTTGSATGVPGVGHVNGRYVVFVSWYHKPENDSSTTVNKGVRISVADITTIASATYRHVLLVEPTGAANYKPVPIHAGGIAWYKNWLYVADTSKGLRVFDLDHLIEVKTGDGNAIGLKTATNEYHAFGYRYILPQVNRYSLCGGTCCTRFSFVSVDLTHSPPSLISGEYTSGNINGRLVRWPLDAITGRLQTTSNAVTSTGAYFHGVAAVQGGMTAGQRLFASSNANAGSYASSLHTGLVGGAVTAYGYPNGVEDLHYSASSTNMWTNTEFPGSRFVFSVKTSKVLAGCK